ncbi:hypothetical protein FO436_08700 [Weissella cibaria]|uniref:hypothetical protein n=1 Tax=Weissella cibaria TaxID=137591 RepID=UPI0011937B31|nr:hypothetical protein [Weissella cibaria]TVV34649.1 hypothetical protein FO436_08700 [Weissella cibaria]
MGLIDKLRGKMEDAQIKIIDMQEKVSKNLVDKQTDAFEKQQQYKQDLINKQNERRRGTSDDYQTSNTENKSRYEELLVKMKSDSRLSDEEFREFSHLDYERQRAETEEFKLGNHNIFDDNDLSPEEIQFFQAFVKVAASRDYDPHLFRLNRLGDKTLNIRYIDGADVKIMDRLFWHREVPHSENFSKPGFQLKTA